MQNINPDQHLGKTGMFFRKIETNEMIFDAVEMHTNEMMNYLRQSVITDTKISDQVFETTKYYLQVHFVSMITEIMNKEFSTSIKQVDKVPLRKVRAIKPMDENMQALIMYNINIMSDPEFPSEDLANNYKLMLEYHLKNVFMVPLYFLALAHKNKNELLIKSWDEMKKLVDQVNYLLYYKKIVVSPAIGKEEFVRDILVAINNIKTRKDKVTISAIAKECNLERPTFYDKCGKLRIELDENYNIVDRETGEKFVFSQS